MGTISNLVRVRDRRIDQTDLSAESSRFKAELMSAGHAHWRVLFLRVVLPVEYRPSNCNIQNV